MATIYMQRRKSGIFEFRKRLPDGLAGRPATAQERQAFPELVNATTGRFKTEVVRSLGTSNATKARRLDLTTAHAFLTMIEAAQGLQWARDGGKTRTLPDLSEIEREATADTLHHDDEARARDYRTGKRGLQPDGLAALGRGITELQADFLDFQARQDTSRVTAEVRVALRRRGAQLDPESEEWHQVGLAIIRGTLRGYELLQDRQAGKVVATPAAEPTQDSPRVSQAFLEWQRGDGGRQPAPGTIREADTAVRRFIELHGDQPLGLVTKPQARAFRDAMVSMPTRLPDKVRAMPLPEILKLDLGAYPPRDPGTVNKLMAMLAAITVHAMRQGRLDSIEGYANPFTKDVKLLSQRVGKDARAAFTPEDLGVLFNAHGSRRSAPDFWFPLIALMTGMRLEEIAGLQVQDLRHDAGSDGWLFDIHVRGGRSVKTGSSVRVVPVHPALIEIGLLRYRAEVAKAGLSSPLWPDLASRGRGQLSARWSKQYGRWLRSLLPDKRKVFHSFRHTFKEMARDAGVPEELHDALTGHAAPGVGRRYGGVSPSRLQEAMGAIKAPRALHALRYP